MWRHIASNTFTLFIVALVLLSGVISWGAHEFRTQGPLQAGICLQVERGSTLRSVSAELERLEAVSSRVIFDLGADYSDLAPKLKAGSFLVPKAASMHDILTLITSSGQSTCGTEVVLRIGVTKASVLVRDLDPKDKRFVDVASFPLGAEDVPEAYDKAMSKDETRYLLIVAEGATSWQIWTALQKFDALSYEGAQRPTEGALAPQSYAFSKGEKVSVVLQRMQQAQDEILLDAWDNRAPDLPIKTLDEALILASIVEKETAVVEERRRVASVFVNRLRKGMKLQTDPTVIYGVTKGEGSLGRGLRRSELRKATPYNTYVIEGLPPTPIANPGRAAIEAALNPDTTNFIFFVADGTGGHAFSTTLKEHNENVAKWRDIEAKRAQE